ncbi:MAG TPA: MgtC/SapB family protein [Solirubrobacteraceae bacterium]|nr:MgtC/SapB family protein [Solirubrobacteraceae bacterium]
MHEYDVLWRLVLALALSSLIGLERELRQKSAGLRTHSLVGLGSAAFMLVSTYGFADVLGHHVTLDPSRVAAQIVSGIGFIGGGIIFVRRDVVRGLTTAAAVWVTAAVGMACGGDLPLIALVTTAMYFLVAYGYPVLFRRLPIVANAPSEVRLVYHDGRGTLRRALEECGRLGFSVSDLTIRNEDGRRNGGRRLVEVDLELWGKRPIAELAADLEQIEGVVDVDLSDRQQVGV